MDAGWQPLIIMPHWWQFWKKPYVVGYSPTIADCKAYEMQLHKVTQWPKSS